MRPPEDQGSIGEVPVHTRGGGEGVDVPPVPENLLDPLLDAAAELLRSLSDDDVPKALRPLAGFDRRGLARGAARQQLLRGLEADDDFRRRAFETFLERPEATNVLQTWGARDAMDRIEAAAERDDLPLLASVLYAARPPGWQYGLGIACVTAARRSSERERDADARARDTRLAALEEARVRADDLRARLEADVKRLEEELRAERRSRREREDRADRRAEAAERRVDEAVAKAARATEERTEAEGAQTRLQERLVKLEGELRAARSSSRGVQNPPTVRSEDVDTLEEAAALARRLATGLEGVAGNVRKLTSGSKGSRTPSTRRSRARVPVPGGLTLDAPDGLYGALRTPGVVLVVDGYNVTMRAWGRSEVAEQRERLVAALAGLQARTRASVTVVFDGADVGAPPTRRSGVRVVFSPEGVEADALVVSEVEALALDVPAVAVSSDRWVQQHARAAGAGVVGSETLLAVLGT